MRERIERLDKYMKYKHLNDNQVTVMCGLSNGLLNKARAGKTDIGINAVAKILNKYSDLNRVWLLTGEGDMIKPDSDEYDTYLESKTKTVNEEKVYTLPLLPIDAMAGKPLGLAEGITLEQCEKYAVPEFIYHGAQMLIRVSGESMVPRYGNGDIIALKEVPDVSFFQWGKIYVLDTNQGALVKRLYEDKSNLDNVICHSENYKVFPDFALPKTSIIRLYVVVGVIRLE